MSLRRAHYAKPTRDDMAIMMVFFNPTQSIRLVQNWLFIWNKLTAAGIPVFGIELVFQGQRPCIADAFKTLTVTSGSLMFHKEKLLERLEREVPAHYKKLCHLDCDIVFTKPDWYDRLSSALEENDVVWPYKTCNWLGPDHRTTVHSNPSAVIDLELTRATHAEGQKRELLSGHPGFAVAMRRDLRTRHFPWAVVGGGDAVFFRGVTGLSFAWENEQIYVLMIPALAAWRPPTPLRTGSIDCDIYHLWHGPLASRQYVDRYAKFCEALPTGETDVRRLVTENADGVWEWREDIRKQMNVMMLRYFAAREDDGIE